MSVAPTDAALGADRCEIWWATPADRPELVALLDDAERTRADQLRPGGPRERYVSAHALVRLLLAPAAGLPAHALVFDTRCTRCGADHGKPRLGPTAGARPVTFNLAHAQDRVVVAITGAAAVGVDVEQIRGRAAPELAALAGDILTTAERAAYHAVPPSDRERALMQLWTRKEAVLKATGEGLAVSPALVSVTGPQLPPAVTGWGPDGAVRHRPGVDPVWLRDLAAGTGYVGAVAVLGVVRMTATEHDADSLLSHACA